MAVVVCQNYPDIAVGITPYPYASGALTITNAAGSSVLWANAFVVPANPFSSGSVKLDTFKWYCTTATGSPKVTASLHSDSGSGVVDAALQAGDEVTIGGTGWITQTWTTKPTLTVGTLYWIVLACTSGTSAALTYHNDTNVLSGHLFGATGVTVTAAGIAWRAVGDSSTDNGGTWGGTNRVAVIGNRIGLTNDTDTAYFGWPVQALTAYTSTYRVDGTTESGVCFTVPASVTLNVRSVLYQVRKGSAPGNVSMKIYTGDATSATATSNAIPAGCMHTSQAVYQFDFATPVSLVGGTKYRFVLSAASGDASNYYYSYTCTMDSDSVAGGTVDLSPGSACLCKLVTGSWMNLVTEVPTFGLILDSAGRFADTGTPGAATMGSNRGFWRGMSKI